MAEGSGEALSKFLNEIPDQEKLRRGRGKKIFNDMVSNAMVTRAVKKVLAWKYTIDTAQARGDARTYVYFYDKLCDLVNFSDLTSATDHSWIRRVEKSVISRDIRKRMVVHLQMFRKDFMESAGF